MGAGRNSFSNMAILLNFPYPARKTGDGLFSAVSAPMQAYNL